MCKESSKCERMDSTPKKCNKIREIVRVHQILKKWKSLANAQKSNKGMKLLRRSFSFRDDDNDDDNNNEESVPKGYLAVCVGKELKRFVIPTHFLTHQAFQVLLQEAEHEFGFQQQGVLQIPCQVSVFENILTTLHLDQHHPHSHEIIGGFDCHPQMCT